MDAVRDRQLTLAHGIPVGALPHASSSPSGTPPSFTVHSSHLVYERASAVGGVGPAGMQPQNLAVLGRQGSI